MEGPNHSFEIAISSRRYRLGVAHTNMSACEDTEDILICDCNPRDRKAYRDIFSRALDDTLDEFCTSHEDVTSEEAQSLADNVMLSEFVDDQPGSLYESSPFVQETQDKLRAMIMERWKLSELVSKAQEFTHQQAQNMGLADVPEAIFVCSDDVFQEWASCAYDSFLTSLFKCCHADERTGSDLFSDSGCGSNESMSNGASSESPDENESGAENGAESGGSSDTYDDVSDDEDNTTSAKNVSDDEDNTTSAKKQKML